MTQPTIKTISPSTREVIAERPETTIEQARRIVNDSKDAFLKFKETKLAERKSIVERALRLIDDRKELLGRELTLQMGRPIAYSTKELDTTQKRAAYLLSTCEDALADIPGQPEAGFTRWVTKQPVGPSLLVFAWNVSIPPRSQAMKKSRTLTGTTLVSLPDHRQLPHPRAPRRQHRHPQTLSTNTPSGRAPRRNLPRRRPAPPPYSNSSTPARPKPSPRSYSSPTSP